MLFFILIIYINIIKNIYIYIYNFILNVCTCLHKINKKIHKLFLFELFKLSAAYKIVAKF